MVSYLYGYGFAFRARAKVARLSVTFGGILSANGTPIASANGSILFF